MIRAAVFLIACAASGQRLTFDVASVKLATPPDGVTITANGGMTVPRGSGIVVPRNTGGPGTDDPARIHYPLITVKALLKQACDSYFAIESPGWTDTETVAVEATMPPGTTKAQFHEMLRNLMIDRFGLKFHIESKEAAGYSLMVGKGGPKMQDRSDRYPPPSAKGFPVPRPRSDPGCMLQAIEGNRARMLCQRETMQDLARELTRMLKTSVTDETGLTATFNFSVAYAGTLAGPRLTPSPADTASDPEPLPDIFSALQTELGLRLQAKKVPVEIVVVDYIDKTPSGN